MVFGPPGYRFIHIIPRNFLGGLLSVDATKN